MMLTPVQLRNASKGNAVLGRRTITPRCVELAKKALELKRKGMTSQEIGDILQCSRGRAWQHVRVGEKLEKAQCSKVAPNL